LEVKLKELPKKDNLLKKKVVNKAPLVQEVDSPAIDLPPRKPKGGPAKKVTETTPTGDLEEPITTTPTANQPPKNTGPKKQPPPKKNTPKKKQQPQKKI